MSASPVNVPALPDDHQLSQQLEHRPNWPDLFAHLEGLTGKQLFESGEFGEITKDQITDMDTQVKKYELLFLDWYQHSPYGIIEREAEKFKKGIRLAEVKRCKDFRDQCDAIIGPYLQLRDNAIAEERRKLEAQQRQQAEEERQREVEALKAQQTPEATQAAEYLVQEPLIPVTVSREQAAIAANVPSAPAKVSGRKVYDYEIRSMEGFLRGVVATPALISMLFSKQTDGSYRLSFTKMKSGPGILSSFSPNNLKITERYETSNRGR